MIFLPKYKTWILHTKKYQKITRSGEEHLRSGHVFRILSERVDVLEVEHVVLHESPLDFLVRPIDEQSIVLQIGSIIITFFFFFIYSVLKNIF